MLYLAQVNKNPLSGQLELHLLAYRQSQWIWQLDSNQPIMLPTESHYREGVIVLVELGNDREIITLQNAKEWILTLIQQYLTEGVPTPEWVQQEETRVEQWRQEITAQSLELTRRQLEIETRRDQLQELEDSLKQEKEKLDIHWQQLQKLQKDLEIEKEKLNPTQ